MHQDATVEYVQKSIPAHRLYGLFEMNTEYDERHSCALNCEYLCLRQCIQVAAEFPFIIIRITQLQPLQSICGFYLQLSAVWLKVTHELILVQQMIHRNDTSLLNLVSQTNRLIIIRNWFVFATYTYFHPTLCPTHTMLDVRNALGTS